MAQAPRDLTPYLSVRHFFGAELRRWRTLRGLSQDELGQVVLHSGDTIGKVEKALRRPSWELAARCDAVLDTGGVLQRLVPLVRTSNARSGPVAVGDQPGVRGRDLFGEADMRRRDLVGGAALAGVAGLTGVAMSPAGSRPPARSGRGVVAFHREVADALAGLYRHADARHALPLVATYTDYLHDLLYDGELAGEQTGPVTFALVDLHALAGLWACHLARPGVAYRHLVTACGIATDTGDPHVRARAAGALSYLYSSAPRGGRGGDPRRALRLLDEATTLARTADGFTRGWLATWRADQYATLGRVDAARREVDRAHRWLEAGGDRTDGFFARPSYGYGMRQHLDSVAATVTGLAGHTDDADRLFNTVQHTAANNRRKVASHAHHALTRARDPRAGDPQAACAAVSDALSLAVAEHYTMGQARAIGVRAGFPPAWSTLSCVRDLDEHIRHHTR